MKKSSRGRYDDDEKEEEGKRKHVHSQNHKEME